MTTPLSSSSFIHTNTIQQRLIFEQTVHYLPQCIVKTELRSILNVNKKILASKCSQICKYIKR